jgi:hypothetical protein
MRRRGGRTVGWGLSVSIVSLGAGGACRVETEISPATTAAVGSTSTSGGADSGSTTGEATGSDEATTGAPMEDPIWAPGVVLASSREIGPRGLVDLRGALHTHSPFSHDACDGEPRDENGVLDAQCMADLRRGLCQVQHDFIFFTDHRDSFAASEYPDVLLFDASRGDELVERGSAVASWAGCVGEDESVAPTLLMAGCEASLMPVGLEHHAPGRGTTYDDVSAAGLAELTAAGAVNFVSHTEDWDAQTLIDLPLDGFEMYNLHANTLANVGVVITLLGQADQPDVLPHPDLLLMPIFTEDPRYLERWGTVLASGVRRVTTMGTDVHRNTFKDKLPDGERVDSFRRMLQGFSNHLRVEPEADGTWDDRHLKAALKAGRLYGAFEYLGYPEGFDAWVSVGGQTAEIGAAVSLAQAPEIVVRRPHVRALDPEAEAPQVELRILRARDAGFDEVASSTEEELRLTPTEYGAYRVEVRIVPTHLHGYLGDYEDLADASRPWIYANPFYIGQ